MQIVYQSLENPKVKFLENTPAWVILSKSNLKQEFTNFCEAHSIPSFFEKCVFDLVTKYALTDNYSFGLEEINSFKDNYPLYREFCYQKKFPFDDYETSKKIFDFLYWYEDELRENVIDDYDHFHDLFISSEFIKQLNIYYQEFVAYIKNLHAVEYKKFLRVKSLLKNEHSWMESIRKTETTDPITLAFLKSLKKYNVVIGLDLVQNIIPASNARAQSEKFIPAGMCYYDKYIFVNTYHYSSPFRVMRNKINSRELFGHELGHAISYVKQRLLKKPDRLLNDIYSHPEFMSIVKKTWLKHPSHKLSYFQRKYLNYFVMPDKKKWNSVDGHWKRPSEETFAETFGYVFDILINGFSPGHVFYKKQGKGMMPLHVKNMTTATLWVLDNLRWELLFPNDKRLQLKLNKIRKYFSDFKTPDAHHLKRYKIDYRLPEYNPKNKQNFTYFR